MFHSLSLDWTFTQTSRDGTELALRVLVDSGSAGLVRARIYRAGSLTPLDEVFGRLTRRRIRPLGRQEVISYRVSAHSGGKSVDLSARPAPREAVTELGNWLIFRTLAELKGAPQRQE